MLTLLSSPDGKKKAYVRLTPEVDALDIANKVRSAPVSPRATANAHDDRTDWLHLSGICSTSILCIVVGLSANRGRMITCSHEGGARACLSALLDCFGPGVSDQSVPTACLRLARRLAVGARAQPAPAS